MGGYDINLELFEPLLKLLEQCKGAKTLSKSASFTLTTLYNSDSGTGNLRNDSKT